MSVFALGTALALFAIVALTVRPLGCYIDDVFAARRTLATPFLAPLEALVYRLCRIERDREMSWQTYTFAMLALSVASIAVTVLVLRIQASLPLDPQGFGNLAPDLAWNTAVSFATTTDWQFYGGESTMSYLSQMTVLAWQNFIAAAIGLAVAIAFVRALAARGAARIGNFWVDVTRGALYVLLPLSIAFTLAFLMQGVPQNFHAYVAAATRDGAMQQITGGPMASQESIKLLGGNGGGFIAANSTAPTENPTALTNLLQLVAMLLVPAALTHTFGRMVRDVAQGWTIFAAMAVLLAAGWLAASVPEMSGNPLVHALGVNGPNLEGKEVRFGAADAGLSLAVATDSTVGASNFAYDSLMPLSGLVALVNMQCGEVAFGGVGSGLYGMLAFVILPVFVAGLLVGRTPEYLGKKIGRRGSAFAGLGANTFLNVATGTAMLLGRYGAIVPTLALAGAFAAQPRNDERSRGTLGTATPLFAALLVGTIVIVGALTFLPADALGPIVEHLLLSHGQPG